MEFLIFSHDSFIGRLSNQMATEDFALPGKPLWLNHVFNSEFVRAVISSIVFI